MTYISLLPRRILTESWASLPSGWQNLDLCTLDYESLQIFATFVCVYIYQEERKWIPLGDMLEYLHGFASSLPICSNLWA